MKTLISKLGALGDVVRATVLLSELEGEIYWLTRESARDLLNSKKINQLYIFEDSDDREQIKKQKFNLILSLDEEKDILEFLREVKTEKLIGLFLDDEEKINYTSEANYWLDMSMVSKKYSRKRTNEIKSKGKKSIPQIWIEMIGRKWTGQEYDLGIKPLPQKDVQGKIGLIDVIEGKWPNKYWSRYPELKKRLQEKGYDVVSLGFRHTLKEHIDDLNQCELIVCGDTLGMHLALALRKKVISLFNCTPPNEIYDYGRMKKIVSPLIEKYIFNRDNVAEAQFAIFVDEVCDEVQKLLGRD